MCLNGDIERQFEFLQQTWLLGSSFHGLEKESDAMLGGPNRGGIFTIPTPDGPLRLRGLRDFVTVRGSGYFFMPGRAALGFLAHGSRRDAAGMARGAIVVQPSPTKTPVTDGNAMEPQPQLAPAEDERER